MRSVIVLGLLLLSASSSSAQVMYIDRATMGRDPEFIARVGVAAQQQSIIAQGEPPETCCQVSTQSTMASSSGKQIVKTLCDVIRPAGDPNANEATKQLSRDRHTARLRFASQVIANAPKWSADMAPIIASDTCVPLDVTDETIQSYMLRLWDIYALPPELANAPVIVTGAPIPPPTPPTNLRVKPGA